MSKQSLVLAAVILAATTYEAGHAQPVATPASAPTPSPAERAAVSTLQSVCMPVLQGMNLKQAASSAGFRQKNGQWVLPIQGKRRIELEPPDISNPGLCSETIVYEATGRESVRQAVDDWASAQSPPLVPVKVDQTVNGVSYQRSISTWAAQTPAGSRVLVLDEEKTLDGKPVQGDLDQASLELSVTPVSPPKA